MIFLNIENCNQEVDMNYEADEDNSAFLSNPDIKSYFGTFNVKDILGDSADYENLHEKPKMMLFMLAKYIKLNEINFENFNKINISEHNEKYTILEWNFVKFRSYFYFDNLNDSNSEFCYLINSNNSVITKRYKFYQFDNNYELIAKLICETIVRIVYGRL